MEITRSKRLGSFGISIVLLFLLAAFHIYFSWRGDSHLSSTNNSGDVASRWSFTNKIRPPEPIVHTLLCLAYGEAQTCPNYYPQQLNFTEREKTACPKYFQWIHEDLKPWTATGITRDMVEKAKRTAHFRLVIHHGKIFVENYRKSIESRDMLTIWGFVQLLRTYPKMLPDVELMFDCDDRPVVPVKEDGSSDNEGGPPPVFRYRSDKKSLDIVFPDWSFWGWPEINIKPWRQLVKDIRSGNNMAKWVDREPYAYLKGNPLAETRNDLVTCNVTEQNDWKARIFIQDWQLESRQGSRNSRLANQCKHRFKIYSEGYGWSVSEKHILACNSLTLLVNPQFHDFFTRGLEPLKHYWPIRAEAKCKSIKYAVEWGNNHTKEAEAIGKRGSNFVLNDVKMDYVYDYMYYLLREYAKLQRFQPEIPAGGMEVCSETMACNTTGLLRECMAQSMVGGPRFSPPCSMAAYEPQNLSESYKKKMKTISMVEKWEET